MAVKIIKVDGKPVKLYPAFKTEAHAHDIEFRKNKAYNMLFGGAKMTDKEYAETEKLFDDLCEILNYIDWPVTYLPYRLYVLAKETILWADCARHH